MCKNACTLQYLFTITVSKSVLIGAARLALFALQAQPTYYTAVERLHDTTSCCTLDLASDH